MLLNSFFAQRRAHGLGLAARLALSCSAALALLSVVTVWAVAHVELSRLEAEQQEAIETALHLLSSEIVLRAAHEDQRVAVALVEDFATLSSIGRIEWSSALGWKIAAEGAAPPQPAPAWFSRWWNRPAVSADRQVVASGKELGTLTVRPHPGARADRLWVVIARAAVFVPLALAATWLVLLWAVARALRPLSALAEGAQRLGQGDFSARIEACGTPEVRTGMVVFNGMADRIENLFNSLRQSDERNREQAALLEHARRELEVANEALALRVHDRTVESSQRETLLRAVMDSAPGIVAYQDAAQCFKLVNRRTSEWLGLPPEAIIGRTLEQVAGADLAAQLQPSIERALAGTPQRTELVHTMPDGPTHVFDVTLLPVVLDGVNITGTASFFRDVTRQREAAQALRATTARNRLLATMVEQSNDAIHARDLDGHVTYWNPAAERLLGFSAEEAMGQPLRALHMRGLGDDELDGVLQRIRSAKCTAFEAKRIDRAGNTIDVAINTAPLFDEAGAHVGEICVHRDITAAKQAERELRQAKDAAEAASRAKSEFLANMSHEIRTPLHGVLGLTDLVLASALSPEQRANLELVRASGTSLMSIINDVLDFSKIEAGHLRLEEIEFDPADSIADMVKVLAPRAHEKRLQLDYDAHGLPPRLLGDPGRLRQIVLNLLGNAIKFTERGEVAVSVSAHGARPDAHEATLQIAVSDSGIGIPADKLGSIFNTFEQADASTTRRYGGTGLGLAVCKKLAELMGGSVSVHSVPGQGTTFIVGVRLRLPQADGLRETGAAPRALAGRTAPAPRADRLVTRHSLRQAAQGGASVLVVEDHETNQLLAMSLLNSLGHRVHIADNGRIGVEDSARGGFDLILMDMQMPVMGGLEAAAAIRHREAGSPLRVPIIALTANAMTGDRESCLAAGMDDYMTKPYSAQELRAVLDRWLPQHAGDALAATAPATTTAATPSPSPSLPSAATALPCLDLNVLRGYVGDDDTDVEAFIRSFLDTTDKVVQRLRAGWQEGDAGAVGAAGHQLKSSSRMVGALALGELCAALEAAGKAQDTPAIDAAMSCFDATLSAVQDAARRWLNVVVH